jgi:hypothetical protein
MIYRVAIRAVIEIDAPSAHDASLAAIESIGGGNVRVTDIEALRPEPARQDDFWEGPESRDKRLPWRTGYSGIHRKP